MGEAFSAILGLATASICNFFISKFNKTIQEIVGD